MQYSLSFAALSSAAIAASVTTSVLPITTYNPCIAVFEGCVASGLTVAGGPNYAYCGAQSEACLKTAFPSSTTSSAPAVSTDNCSLVFESCVQSGMSLPGGPNFAYCGAQSQACLRTAYPSSTSTVAPTASAYITTSKQFTTLVPPTTRPRETTTYNNCGAVYESCVQSGLSVPGGPNFAYCGAQSEACLKTATATATSTCTTPAPVYTTKVVTKYTTYCPSATTIVVNPTNTITVTSATTLTITDCPCTITTQVPPPVGTVPPPVVSPVSSGSVAPGITYSLTYSVTLPIGTSTSPSTTAPATYTGAAERSVVNLVDMAAAAAAAAAAFLV